MNDVDTYTPALDDVDERGASAVSEFTFARCTRQLGAIGFALAILFSWFGLPALRHANAPKPTARIASQHAALSPVAHHSGPSAKRIEDIQLGDRAAGRNPFTGEVEDLDPEPASWREVRLRLAKEDGHTLWMSLLRPVEWIDISRASVGGTIELDLPEMGAVGQADVLEIFPCRKIDAGDGTVVTGLFRHEVVAQSIVELRIDGQAAATRVTANHRYWSLDRTDFVAPLDLEFGPGKVVPGDTNDDQQVDIVDLNNVRNNFGRIGDGIAGDFIDDQFVGIEDLNSLRNHFGAQSVAPAPASGLLLAGCGGIVASYLVRRRMKHESV